ncbi:MAG TPA: CCA tRNA nucleotidyltransferase [Aliidongia sp.]|nr:CCA tRNA nucleotidyltransferase [Aliidongia sp.]
MTGPARRIAVPARLAAAPVRTVLDALGEARFVGGAVRDTLLDRPIGDIDLATPLTPETVMAKLAEARIRFVPTGLAHGTITALADHQPIEITTLRHDVETDGRHAIVAFTDDWAADAARRDFTMNALYLDAEGGLWDPVGGIEDCLAGRVRFVGDARQRITEDVLRLLRFYRFLAHFARAPADPAARAACRTLAPGLHNLAGERIRVELLKLLGAPDPVPTIRMMIEDQVLREILPEPADIARLARLVPIEPVADPLRRLAALLPADAALAVAERLRLSVKERERLLDMNGRLDPPDLDGDAPAQRRALYRLGTDRYRDLALLRAAGSGAALAVPDLLALADAWPVPRLPVAGADALAAGISAGTSVGAALRAVEAWWIEGDFRAGREACLARLAALGSGSNR